MSFLEFSTEILEFKKLFLNVILIAQLTGEYFYLSFKAVHIYIPLFLYGNSAPRFHLFKANRTSRDFVLLISHPNSKSGSHELAQLKIAIQQRMIETVEKGDAARRADKRLQINIVVKFV